MKTTKNLPHPFNARTLAVFGVLFVVFLMAGLSTAFAQARAPQLDLSVKAHCDGSTAVFVIRNQGKKWRKPATVKIMAPEGRQVLTKRRMRMAANQSVTLRQRHAARYGEGVSLNIDVKWGNVPEKAAKKISCR